MKPVTAVVFAAFFKQTARAENLTGTSRVDHVTMEEPSEIINYSN